MKTETIMTLEVGDKVNYTPKRLNGIVKSFNNDMVPFVVYHCNEDWENYQDYTAESTNIRDLTKGWRLKV